jgi:hypothetical protein
VTVVLVGVEVVDIACSLRRHYPVRFRRSADPRAVVRTPPSQPTTWCELPKSFVVSPR